MQPCEHKKHKQICINYNNYKVLYKFLKYDSIINIVIFIYTVMVIHIYIL